MRYLQVLQKPFSCVDIMFAVFVLSADIYWFIDIISIWKDCSKDGKAGWWLENLAILWSNNPNLVSSPSLSTVYFPFLLKLGDFILIQISCQFIAQWFQHKVDQAGNRTSPRRAIFKILLIWSSLQAINIFFIKQHEEKCVGCFHVKVGSCICEVTVTCDMWMRSALMCTVIT